MEIRKSIAFFIYPEIKIIMGNANKDAEGINVIQTQISEMEVMLIKKNKRIWFLESIKNDPEPTLLERLANQEETIEDQIKIIDNIRKRKEIAL
jgi:hypothetical protein